MAGGSQGYGRMSFRSIFSNIGKGILAAEKIAAPIAEGLLPQFAPAIMAIDSIFGHVQSSIITIEHNNPADGQGGIKQDAVLTDFAASIDSLQSILAVTGKKLTYDEGELKAGISDQVSAYNHFAKVKASFKVEQA